MAAFFDNMKLTIKAIIRWEQLRDKSFSEMDYSDPEDVDTMLYTMNVADEATTYDVFRRTLKNKKLYADMAKQLSRELAVMSQYVKHSGEKPAGKPERIEKIVAYLVMKGLSADYAMEKMSVADLNTYLEETAKLTKERLEYERYWTYWQVAPHCTKDCLKDGPVSIVRFPWEREEKEEITKDDIQMFETFMSKGKDLFKN